MAKWTPVRNVKGLTFASPAAQSPQTVAPTTASPLGFLDSLQETSVATGKHIAQTATEAVKRGAAAGTKNKLWENPFFIGVLLLFCWPVGLVFVWLHPAWKKQTKWILTGAFVGLIVIGMMVGSHGKTRETSPAYQKAYREGVATAEQDIREDGLDTARTAIAERDEQVRKESRASGREVDEISEGFRDGYRDTVKKHR